LRRKLELFSRPKNSQGQSFLKVIPSDAQMLSFTEFVFGFLSIKFVTDFCGVINLRTQGLEEEWHHVSLPIPLPMQHWIIRISPLLVKSNSIFFSA